MHQHQYSVQLFAQPEFSLVFLSFVFNFIWEVVQSPFYLFKREWSDNATVCTLYCTGVDVFMTLGIFWLVACIAQNRWWFLDVTTAYQYLFLGLAVASSIFMEYLNVFVAHDWKYASFMPTVAGIGMFPILQWLLIPQLIVFILRRQFGQGRRAAASFK